MADERRAGERWVELDTGTGLYAVRSFPGPYTVALLPTEADADLLATGPARLARLAAANGRLREALEFYADPVSWMWWTARPETKDTRPALVDSGDKARAALAAAGEPGGVT